MIQTTKVAHRMIKARDLDIFYREAGPKDSPGRGVEELTAMLGRRHCMRVSISNKESRWQPCRRTSWTGIQDEPRSE
jgi:hypothetical protein